MITIPIQIPKHFSFGENLWFLSREDGDRSAYQAGSISRAIRVDGEAVSFTLTEKGQYLQIELMDEHNVPQVVSTVKAYIEDWFDIKRNIEPFYRLLEAHPGPSYMVTDFNGLRVMGNPDTFETLVWSITSQQINMTFAIKLKRALCEKYGESVEHHGRQLPLFPLSKTLAELEVKDLQELQFSRQKATYIISAATAFADGTLSKEKLMVLSSQERIDTLTALKGVGIWTANAVMMQSLNDPSGLPLGDTGLLKALLQHGLIIDKKDTTGITTLFRQFDGWQSYLFNYLWRSLSGPRDR